MIENRYKVLIGNEVIARDMDIKTATILVRTLFDEYYDDPTISVTIKREEVISCVE